jgi:hypothetical protein
MIKQNTFDSRYNKSNNTTNYLKYEYLCLQVIRHRWKNSAHALSYMTIVLSERNLIIGL